MTGWLSTLSIVVGLPIAIKKAIRILYHVYRLSVFSRAFSACIIVYIIISVNNNITINPILSSPINGLTRVHLTAFMHEINNTSYRKEIKETVGSLEPRSTDTFQDLQRA